MFLESPPILFRIVAFPLHDRTFDVKGLIAVVWNQLRNKLTHKTITEVSTKKDVNYSFATSLKKENSEFRPARVELYEWDARA